MKVFMLSSNIGEELRFQVVEENLKKIKNYVN